MKKALITGANRGIGLEFATQLKQRGYYVIGCYRQINDADELKLIADEIIQLDITNDDDISNLKNKLQGHHIDLLINNAGITGEQGVTVGNIKRDNFLNVLNVNCVSTIMLTDALLDSICLSDDKYVLVISSRMGSIADNEAGRSYAYRSSKAALNCVMRSFAIDVQQLGVKLMLLHPGWVKTNLGGNNAPVDVVTSVRGMLQQMDSFINTSQAETMHSYDGSTIPW